MTESIKDYRVISAEKKLQQQSRIPKEWLLPDSYLGTANLMDVPLTCGVLSNEECNITSNFDATALLDKLKAGEWSAEQVTVAFCKRAAVAHQLTNCLTEIFFDEAIQRARELDRERQLNTDKDLRPFHGLPISLKDSFQVSGHDTSTGLACFVNEPAEEHSGMAAMLVDLGAVLYCKTNLPQIIMSGDTDNNVFGRTLNPRNTSLTAGGSTGGEGALLALRGSIVGVGTDIAGSIRIPAVCNRLYGFRPSVGIVPHSGVRDLTVPGTDGVRSTAGPLVTSIRDAALFLKTIMQMETWKYDSAAVSVPWTNLRPTQKVRIGLVLDEGIYTPSPPVRRGLNMAAELLQQSENIKVVPITLPSIQEIYSDTIKYFTLLGGQHYYELFDRTGEPEIPSLKAIGLLSMPGTDLRGFFDLNVRRQAAARQFQQLFHGKNLDAILMPPAPHTALPHDQWTSATYTGLWNYLDYPAVVIPVDTVCKSDLADDISNAKYGAEDARLYSLYTGPEDYKDAPICIQLVGYHHADEKLTHTAALVDSIINGKA
ncbi:amidase [Aaosphaeria arxii CBS 175.79]|uniref:Amidase n=1 Tax=Aaosphaeria arxii CBS 175.79 TaxID=1450172 RepID=A0A6A5X8K7_9PLEO|nr:amidase [Aaosphaeria arxii CBS 175.79]KAF2009229.1 amidase [Aaosphaeria arxii CBS 175.79]